MQEKEEEQVVTADGDVEAGSSMQLRLQLGHADHPFGVSQLQEKVQEEEKGEVVVLPSTEKGLLLIEMGD